MKSHPVLLARITVSYPKHPAVLRDLELEMRQGEILGLVGPSGSGKSTIALSLLRLLEYEGGKVEGSICLNGRELMALKERELRKLRGREIGFVPQNAASALNPVLRLGGQMEQAWKAHARGGKQQCRARVLEALRDAGLNADESFLRRRPSQISTGQAQRALIAMALLHRPTILIADEPTSALDIITQREILNLFRAINRDSGAAVLFISHDLLAVANLCHRIAILNAGEIVECAPPRQIFSAPVHDYTRKLVRALPESPFPMEDLVTPCLA